MRLAMLLGCSGAGKGFVAEYFRDRCPVIVIDHVRSDVLKPLGLPREKRYRWKVWDRLPAGFDAASGIASSLRERCSDLAGAPAALAEGALLGHGGFRQSFLSGLAMLGVHVDAFRLIRLEPPPEVILANRRKRGRDSDREATLGAVEGELADFKRRALGDHVILATTEQARAEIERFLSLGPRPLGQSMQWHGDE